MYTTLQISVNYCCILSSVIQYYLMQFINDYLLQEVAHSPHHDALITARALMGEWIAMSYLPLSPQRIAGRERGGSGLYVIHIWSARREYHQHRKNYGNIAFFSWSELLSRKAARKACRSTARKRFLNLCSCCQTSTTSPLVTGEIPTNRQLQHSVRNTLTNLALLAMLTVASGIW